MTPERSDIFDWYFEVSHPDLPKDLQFLPPDVQRKVYENYKLAHKSSSDFLREHKLLIVDFVIFAIAPLMLLSRYDKKKRFPNGSNELPLLIEEYTMMLLEDLMEWKELDLSIKTQSLVFKKVLRTILPFCNTADYVITDEVQDEMAWERIRARFHFANNPPTEQLQALAI